MLRSQYKIKSGKIEIVSIETPILRKKPPPPPPPPPPPMLRKKLFGIYQNISPLIVI